MAALILTAGVFADVHGRKKVYQASSRMAHGQNDYYVLSNMHVK
ncbi:hypothetical protein ACFWTE_14370 [Nocardiopsis sp. NPDC058631]